MSLRKQKELQYFSSTPLHEPMSSSIVSNVEVGISLKKTSFISEAGEAFRTDHDFTSADEMFLVPVNCDQLLSE